MVKKMFFKSFESMIQMKVSHILIAGMTILVAVIVITLMKMKTTTPKGLVCANALYDAGRLLLNHDRESNNIFKLKNTSDHEIVIKKVISSCTCTAAKLDTFTVKPKEEIKVPVRVQWSSKLGLQEQAVTIETDNEYTPILKLKMLATLYSPLELTPKAILFGNIAPAQEKTHSIKIIRHDKSRPLKITNITSLSKNIQVIELDEGHTMLVKIVGSDKKHEDMGKIIFATNCEEMPIIELPVFAIHEGNMKVSPSMIMFTEDEIRNKTEKSVKVIISKRNSQPKIHLLPDDKQCWFAVKNTTDRFVDKDAEELSFQIVPENKTPSVNHNNIGLRIQNEDNVIEIPIHVLSN